MKNLKNLLLMAGLILCRTAMSQCDCDHVLPYNFHPDGVELGVKPGDVICLDGDIEYDAITFSNIHGTPENPVIITNCNGKAVVKSNTGYGIKFTYSDNIKVLGNGDPSVDYGISITTKSGFYLTMEFFTTDLEIAHVEIAGSIPGNPDHDDAGFSAIAVKTTPYMDCLLFRDKTRTAWVMNNIHIHHNYVHDVGGEGIYMGHGFYGGRVEPSCKDLTTDTLYSHSIKHVRIHDNFLENIGYDGLQIKNADEDVEIYNNIVLNAGVVNNGNHNEGFFLGEGTTGKFYNNWLQNTTGNGMRLQGIGNNEIFNNVVINAGEASFEGAHGAYVVRNPGWPFKIYHNTFIGAGNEGFVFFNNDGGEKIIVNNVFSGYNTSDGGILNKSTATFAGNLEIPNPADLGIVDPTGFDLHLLPTSPLVNTGVNPADYGIELDFDYDYKKRPQEGKHDVGAFEYSYLTGNQRGNGRWQNVMVYPNPATDNLKITYTSIKNEPAQIKILGSDGGSVFFSKEVMNSFGVNQELINLKELKLQSGMYILQIESDTISYTKKIIVK